MTKIITLCELRYLTLAELGLCSGRFRSNGPLAYALRFSGLSSRLELDDKPASRTTSFEPTMGIGRPFRRIDLCDAKHDHACLDLLPEPIELLELLCVGPYRGCREVDIPLRSALEAADGVESPAVTNGGDDKLLEHRSVREPIDSLREVLANPRCNIIAPANYDVGAKRRDELFVFLGSIGDDGQPLGFGELDDVAAISARRPGHCDYLTRRELE